MLHPRVPAGQAGGGKFASSGSKGGKGAGKGAKGGKKSAAAVAAEGAKTVLPQLMRMNPQQRAQFLAKLTDPQLKALLHEASQGNSNDPSTRAALTAIKDQIAARSLTGAKGPTATNAAKAAAASKKAATAKASADKKAASAAKAASEPAAPKATTTPKATASAPAPVLKSAADIRAAVQADAKVSPPMQPAYRRKVITAARNLGALRSIPAAWLKPGT